MPDEELLGAWVNLGQAAHVVQTALDQRLERAAGVSGAEFELLWRLNGTPAKRLQMTEIAGLLLASKSGVTRLVDRLVEGGLVSRETPPENRRVTYAQLTPRGKAVLASAQVAFEEGFETAFARHLSAGDVRAMRRILRRLLQGNGAWAHDRCDPALVDQDAQAS
ncbi:MAG: MarR family transcriptional regulator [Chloroflexi bacterium]|nr:MAG: MarR family transcriptional regulator [Chloroflexota bacterium]TME20695.1 MAG: MarR family transcriptional regulator [Chloroflexota bacterium]